MADTGGQQKKAVGPYGLVLALAALGLLLVLLLFRTDRNAEPAVDQGPIAKALVDNLMTNGVLVDYDCEKTSAWVNLAVWTKYTRDQRSNMVVSLATVCSAQRGTYRISVLDYDSKREIAAFDGTSLKLE